MADEIKDQRTIEDVLNDLDYITGDVTAQLCGVETLRRVDGAMRPAAPLVHSVLNLRDVVDHVRDVVRERVKP
jgi:hypothetical protein